VLTPTQGQDLYFIAFPAGLAGSEGPYCVDETNHAPYASGSQDETSLCNALYLSRTATTIAAPCQQQIWRRQLW
jgi:hypothetical protein